MNPTDFAWAAAQSIVQKTPKEIKVIVDGIEYPILERDSVGYIIHLSEPRRVRENLFSLHGAFFDNDRLGKASLWRMYRASLYHLCMHSAITDYSIYVDFASSRDPNNAMFSISMAEDYAIRGYMRTMFPGLCLDEAYASYLSTLRLRDLSREKDLANLIAANLLSYQMVGKPATNIMEKGLDQEIENVHASLVKSSFEITGAYSQGGSGAKPDQHVLSELKIKTAKLVDSLFEERNLRLGNVHAPPFAEAHGTNYLFDSSAITIAEQDKKNAISLRDSINELSISPSEQDVRENEGMVEYEGNTIISDWEYSLVGRQRLVDSFREVDPQTHFEEFTFPSEDYSEFVRTRSKLIGPIRRVLDQLRQAKNTADEVTMKESGYVDIPIAIQVVASKSDRSDVFLQDEVAKKSEAWAILIDSSKSLETLKGEAKDIAVCLAEIARDLIPDQTSWAIYSFDERMYILKDFNEMYGNAAKARIGGLQNGIKTYLPDAIRIATKRLAKSNENMKVLLVASDGFPLGYDGIEENLLDAIEKANKAGIQLIGLGVGSSLIRKYFRSNCVIDGPYDLMNHFVRTYYELAGA